MGVGLEDYKLGPKNNWRRRTANAVLQALRSCGKRPCDAKVVYLPGPSDCETDLLISKGFHPRNLFPVESREATWRQLKSARNPNRPPVTLGDLWQVAAIMQMQDRAPDVIMADLTTTATDYVAVRLCLTGLFERQVVSLTLQKGRENKCLTTYRTLGVFQDVRPGWMNADRNRIEYIVKAAIYNQWEIWAHGNHLNTHCNEPAAQALNDAFLFFDLNEYRADSERANKPPLMCSGVFSLDWRESFGRLQGMGLGNSRAWGEEVIRGVHGKWSEKKKEQARVDITRRLAASDAEKTKRFGKDA